MDREKKAGITLIVFGICFPLILLPFVSGYDKDKSTIQNLFHVGIVLKKEQPVTVKEVSPSSLMKIFSGRLPYRFILAIAIFLIFAGIVKIDIAKRNDSDQNP